MIIGEKIGKYYEDNSGVIWPVKGVDLRILDGRFVAIVGRSGSGKSTLLKMLGGLMKPNEGRIEIDGEEIYSLSEKDIASYRCNKVGFVFQDYFLEEMYTVYQNIEIVLMISKININCRKEMIYQVLEEVKMFHKKDAYVKNLSGGEKQRVCLARAIVNNPQIIYADEPCGNLDYENSYSIMKLLRKQADLGRTVVLVTHNMDDAKMTDEIIKLQDGKIVNHEILRHNEVGSK